jgi:transporter family protein
MQTLIEPFAFGKAMESWVFFAILAVLLTGTAGVISKYALRNATVSTFVISSFIVIMPVSIALLSYYILAKGLGGIEPIYFVLGLLSAFFANLGFFLYFDSLERGPLLIVGPITSAYPAIIVVVALLVFDEMLNPLQALGVTLTIAAVITLLYLHGASMGRMKCPRSALGLAILVVISWGAWGILLKAALTGLDVILYLGLSALVMPPLTLGYLKLRNRGKSMREMLKIPAYSIPLIFAVISVELEQLGFYNETLAVSTGPASLVFPVIAAYPVVTIVIAYAFLKERISLKEALLIFAVVTGIILVSTV